MTTTIATNGKRYFFSCGKRISRQMALELANKKHSDDRNDFTVQIEIASTYSYTSENHTYELQLDIVEGRGFTVRFVDAQGFFNEIFSFDTEAEAKALVTKIEDAFITGDLGIKINADGSTSKIDNNTDINNDAEQAQADNNSDSEENNTMTNTMFITAKSNAEGKFTAYYLNGEKIRKSNIRFYACNPAYNGVIVVDYDIAKNSLNFLFDSPCLIIFKNRFGLHDVTNQFTAKVLGLELGKKVSINPDLFIIRGSEWERPFDYSDEPKFEVGKTYFVNIDKQPCTVEVKARTECMLSGIILGSLRKLHIHSTAIGEYVKVPGNQDDAMIWASNEIKLIAIEMDGSEDDSTDDNTFDLLPNVSELNDVDEPEIIEVVNRQEADNAVRHDGISNEMYRRYKALRREVEYSRGRDGKPYWFSYGSRISTRRAEEILAEYGFTVDTYLGNLGAFEDMQWQMAMLTVNVKRKIKHDRRHMEESDRRFDEDYELAEVERFDGGYTERWIPRKHA